MVTNNSINNTVGSSDSGLTNTLTVQNTSNTAASQAQINTVVGGTTSGDAWNQLTVGTTRSYAIGIDNSDVNDSLKFTTDADGTVDPSSGTFLGAINPSTGGLEWGPDANATSSAAKIISAQKNYDGSTTIGVANTNSGTSALAGYIASNDATFATITVPSSGNSTAAIRNKLFINSSDAANDGIVYNTRAGGSHSFYGNVAGGGLFATLNSNGLTVAVQPSFLGYLGATVLNKTGNGTVYTLGTDALTEVYDRGSNFTTAGVFTAPVTGIYDLRAQVTVTGNTIATTFVISIVTTARTYTYTFTKAAGAQDESVSISALADMNATNTATVTIAVSGEAADTSDIKGGATLETYFCGTLVA